MTTASPVVNPNAYIMPPTSYAMSSAITVGSSAGIAATRGVAFNLSVAGAVTLTMSNGGTVVCSAGTGYTQLNLSVTGISSSGATGTYYGLY